jgi:CRP-like cAMP-binding protein
MPRAASASLRQLARATVQRDPWFAAFSPADVLAWTEQSPLLHYDTGERLCRRGGAVPALSVVVSGTLEVTQVSVAGRRHVWSYLGGGQWMNLVPVLDAQPAIHDVTAHEPTTVLQIPAAAFRERVADCPKAMGSLLRLLCCRSRVLYEHVADHALLPLRARCARALLSLMLAHGLPRPHGVAISLKVSQTGLADMLGCTRQSVNRELKALERQGVIAMRYSTFAILDGMGLRRLAEQP